MSETNKNPRSQRTNRVRNSAFRYADNIRSHLKGMYNYNNPSDDEKKYPRSVYMGLSAG